MNGFESLAEFSSFLDIAGAAAQKHGLSSLRIEKTIELIFKSDYPRIMYTGAGDNKTGIPIGERHGMPTDDELLFASSIPLTPGEIEAQAPHG